MKRYLIGGAVVVLLIAGLIIWALSSKQKSTAPDSGTDQKQADTGNITFSNPKKSAHYQSNTPSHGAILGGVPVNVVIDFDFDLARPSEIKIINNGKDYGEGETIIDSNKLSMRRNLVPDAGDGLYTVEYKACWPDGSCHDGNFQFAIEPKEGSFEDQTGKSDITVELVQFQFVPKNIKVSKGTRVTWVNKDSDGHYVNTDSHPAHTYYPSQNSKLLKNGDEFSLVFNESGIYPYHCSAHASSMTGSLLVE